MRPPRWARPALADTSETVSNPSDLLASDFSLDKGYTVKLSTLPIESTDQAAADDAVAEAEDGGAKDVGIINPATTRRRPTRARRLHRLLGRVRDEGRGEKALADLKKDFPDAEVIA